MNGLDFLQDIKFPFPIRQQVLWGEMDVFQHINNVAYFRYFETGRVEFLTTQICSSYLKMKILELL